MVKEARASNKVWLDGKIVEPQDANISIFTECGGGYGAPAERPREKVLADVRDGYVTPEAAKRVYRADV